MGCPRDQNSFPPLDNQEQLSPAFFYVTIDGREYIDVAKSKCNSRTFQISKYNIGAIDMPIVLNIKECDRIVGRGSAEYSVFATWMESFRQWLLE